MLFSNISSYFYGEKLERYSELLMSLEENLEDDGIIQIGYGSKDYSVRGSLPLHRRFVEEHKDRIIEIERKNKVITYYHK